MSFRIIKDGAVTIKGNEYSYTSTDSVAIFPTKADAVLSLNSEWSISLEVPFEKDLNEHFCVGNIISIEFGDIIASERFNHWQLFRIKKVDKSSSKFVCNCVPIFMDASGYIIPDTKMRAPVETDQNGNVKKYGIGKPFGKVGQILSYIFDKTPFVFSSYSKSDNKKEMDIAWRNILDCVTSDSNDSILNSFSGEILFNNYELLYADKFDFSPLDDDTKPRVSLGFNMTGIKVTYDSSSCVSEIYPLAYNDIPLKGKAPTDSELPDSISIKSKRAFIEPKQSVIKYEKIKLKEDASTNESEDVIVCNTYDELYKALTKAALDEFENGIDVPKITYDVDFIDLSQTREYGGIYQRLVTLHLGDTVMVYNKDIDVHTKARVISIEYDCVNQLITKMTLGDYKEDYFKTQAKVTSATNRVINTSTSTANADTLSGIIDGKSAQIQVTKDYDSSNDIKALKVENLIGDTTYGAMAISADGLMVTTKRNKDGSGWDWSNGVVLNPKGIFFGKLGNSSGTKYIQFNGSGLQTVDGKSTGVGITREANVTSIKTVNGIVVGVG